VLARVRNPIGGITLFRALNIVDPDQVARLTGALQSAARDGGQPPLLIATDQEGGQLMALGEWSTPFPGNMALGATGSTAAQLARQVGHALGRELRSLGINVDYAPVCDVNSNPLNPVVGTRSFGEDPQAVGALAAAMIDGLQTAGVAATAKHFPGHGDTASDSHFGTPVVEHDLDRLLEVELPPFVAAIRAGVQLVMLAHVDVPAISGQSELPATLSRAVVDGLLRQRLGFSGVSISDSLDMAALAQGPANLVEAMAAVAAGVDLLLLGPRHGDVDALCDVLAQAARRGLLDLGQMTAAAERVLALKRWFSEPEAGREPPPSVSVLGCAEHRALARTVAERSVTVVRNDAGVLPLRLAAEQQLAVVLPYLTDLTPADTSSYVRHTLAEHMQRHHRRTVLVEVSATPDEHEIEDVLARTRSADAVVMGTINACAQPAQARLVAALLEITRPTVVAALRLPYDLMAFPSAPTYVCTYSVQDPPMQALAAILFGELEARGTLPVSIPGLYARGHSAA
jgi:beta-N-acetylhexosaminidase